MTFKVVIETVDHSEPGVEKSWCRLNCRDQNGRYARVVAFDAVSSALVARLGDEMGKGQSLSEISGRRVVVDVQGTWRSDAEGRGRYLAASKFNVLTGPAAELFQTRAQAVRVLKEATTLAKSDPRAAYARLEEFVALLGQRPVPSLDGPEASADVEVRDEVEARLPVEDAPSPEVEAARRMGVVVDVPEAGPVEPAVGLDAAADVPAPSAEPAAPAMKVHEEPEPASPVETPAAPAAVRREETIEEAAARHTPPEPASDPIPPADEAEEKTPARVPAPAQRREPRPGVGFNLGGGGFSLK